jgi:predicted secreted Zn-dependent protease
MPMLSRWIGAALSVVVVGACMGVPGPSPSPGASQDSAAAAATPSATVRTTPRPPTPSATPAPVAGPLAGVWRVRKILALEDRSALIPGAAFDEEAFVVTPDCDSEPCPSVEVRMTPLGRAEPVTIAVLERDGDRYVSAAQAENEGPCLDEDGDRVLGGATVTSTLRLWLASVRAAGTAVETTQLMGSLELQLDPTDVGSAAGCAAQTAAYELTGRREAVAVRTDPLPEVDEPPNTAGGLANLPSISVKVTGVEITYFPIEGDTLAELAASLANGGLKACGAINYEWHRGEDRPAACAITAFPGFEEAIERRTDASSGTCKIVESTVKARFSIHFPRWTAPKRVPKRLLAWWREVVEFIRDHEAQHVVISRDHVKRLNASLVGAGCSETGEIVGAWADRLSSAQEEFDRVEYQRPWPVPPAGY